MGKTWPVGLALACTASLLQVNFLFTAQEHINRHVQPNEGGRANLPAAMLKLNPNYAEALVGHAVGLMAPYCTPHAFVGNSAGTVIVFLRTTYD
jgi:hypothetical protein